MDNQVNANSPVGATANGSATQEVSSTTQAVEPTKRSLRVQTWRKIQENNCGIGLNAIFNRIPGFVDSDKAVALLAGTEEFKKSQTIKVSIDRALQGAKLQALLDSKTLFLPGTRDSTALYLRVDVPDDATEERKKEILNVQDVQQNRTSISLDDKVTLDMIIIGSVLVSRDGYRIGRGNGFTDLDIGLLIEVGAITKDTIIATIVHDLQVVDNLPTSLFQKYDTPVDLIATPTEVIRVANRLPRPEGLFWELLSQRRLKIIPVLQILKERQEKDGKLIALKAEDTDVEQNQNNRNRRRIFKRRYGRKNTTRRAVSQTDTEHQGGDNAQQRRYPRRNKRFVNNRRRRPTKSEGDQSGVEVKSEERKPVADKRKPRIRRDRPANEFCVKLSNISRDVRVKDLKTELRKRKCNPFYINWKGQYGKCYLHFGQRNGSTAATDEEINKVLQLLADFSLTVTLGGGGNASGAEGDGAGSAAQPLNTKTVNVNVELVKFDGKNKSAGGDDGNGVSGANGTDAAAGGDAGAARIESVDTTTVQYELGAVPNGYKFGWDIWNRAYISRANERKLIN